MHTCTHTHAHTHTHTHTHRPPSPIMDSVREKYVNHDKLAEDFSVSLRGPDLADVLFLVGERKVPLYGVKAILACRSRSVVPVFICSIWYLVY